MGRSVHAQKQIAFTLIENLIVLVIVAVLLVAGIRFGHQWYQKQLILTEKNKLVSLLNYARNQSFLRRHQIVVCPKLAWDAKQGCQQPFSWRGPILVVDASDAKSILMVASPIDKRLDVKYVGFQKDSGVQLNAETMHATSSGHFELVLGRYKCRVLLNRAGRVRTEISG